MWMTITGMNAVNLNTGLKKGIVNNINDKALPMYVFSNIKVRQSRNLIGDYVVSVYLNETLVYSDTLEKEEEWDNAKVYIGSPWNEPANAIIKNFKIYDPGQ